MWRWGDPEPLRVQGKPCTMLRSGEDADAPLFPVGGEGGQRALILIIHPYPYLPHRRGRDSYQLREVCKERRESV